MTFLAFWAAWLAATGLAVALLGWDRAKPFVAGAAASHAVTLLLVARAERRKWVAPIRRLAGQVDELARNPVGRAEFEDGRATDPIARSLRRLAEAHKVMVAADAARIKAGDSGPHARLALTRSAVMEATPSDAFEKTHDPTANPNASGDFSTTDAADMVNRLEPRLLRWLESSPAEQEFLGWDLRQLREKSFLEIVHPDDLDRVKDQLRTALIKGEVHGLILRIRTAHGKKAIEMNVGARYGADMSISHLRCHVTDVTAKVRAEREARLKAREIEQANEQLRLINRELEELKERYLDLYQNAPAMYFSLDVDGKFLECNDTFLRTLGFRREAVIGQSFEILLPEHHRPLFAERFAAFLLAGTIEINSQWLKPCGEVIDVWVTGTAVRDPAGRIVHSRSVAQDVTARHRLEAELQEKNARLATTIEELSRRNKEMDEFTYVVSHDLQEPLRTLTAFSDFLLRDYGDRLDAEGQEFVRYIVDASRRMRALIQDLLSLSRAGKVAAEFSGVQLEEVIGFVRADLAELIRSKRAEVRVDGPLPEVWGDRQRLGQLFANLISNGLKYNDKPDPRVEVGSDCPEVGDAVAEPGLASAPRPVSPSTSATTVSGSTPSFIPGSSSSSGGSIPARSTKGPGLGWRSARRSCRPTAAGSGSRASQAGAPRFSSPSAASPASTPSPAGGHALAGRSASCNLTSTSS